MPRKPHRHKNPNRAIHNRTANPKRAAKRLESQMIFLRQMRKEKEIGPDPLYDHGRGRSEFAWLGEIQKWRSLSDQYDREVIE